MRLLARTSIPIATLLLAIPLAGCANMMLVEQAAPRLGRGVWLNAGAETQAPALAGRIVLLEFFSPT